MARTGPAPKPAELRALEGNRGHRAVDITGVFRPEVGLPPMPKDLSPGARKVWKRLSPELLRYNLLSTVYSDAFEDLCETISDVKMLRHALRARQALLRADGKPEADAWCVNTPNGMPVQHPLVLNLRNTRADMHRLIAQFGLTPAESARVTTAVRAQLQLFDNTGAAAAARPAGSTPTGFAEF
jgi:P27 family predicted phage terminase small subunit